MVGSAENTSIIAESPVDAAGLPRQTWTKALKWRPASYSNLDPEKARMWGFVDSYTNQAQVENVAMSVILEVQLTQHK